MKSYVILIGGGSASGKTLLTQYIKKELDECVCVINIDNFYKNNPQLSFEERTKVNYDHPDSIDSSLMIKCIKQLKSGMEIDIPIYDFANHLRSINSIHIKPCRYIIVDGIFALYYQELLNIANLTIYVDADQNIRLNRRIVRDINERGRTKESVLKQFKKTVAPMHNIYIEPTKNNANHIFINNQNNGLNQKQVEVVVNKIKNLSI